MSETQAVALIVSVAWMALVVGLLLFIRDLKRDALERIATWEAKIKHLSSELDTWKELADDRDEDSKYHYENCQAQEAETQRLQEELENVRAAYFALVLDRDEAVRILNQTKEESCDDS